MAHNFVIPPKAEGKTNIESLYTPEQEKAIASLVFVDGKKKIDVARDLNIHRNTVANICNRWASEFQDQSAESET